MGKTIMVTGAGGGIGQALAQTLLRRGDAVIACARAVDQLAVLAASGASAVAFDVGDDEAVRIGVTQIEAIDAVVHCAAIAPAGTVEFTSPAQVAHVHNVNTLGALRVMQAALPLLRAAPSGRLILVSSLWGQVSGPFVSAYAASKHAIEAMTDSLRRETRGHHLHISVVEPGVIKTPMYHNQIRDLDAAIATMSDSERALYAKLYQQHRKLLGNGGRTAITADQCAKVILKCLDATRPRARYRAGTDAKLMVTLGRLLPDRGLDFVFSQIYKG